MRQGASAWSDWVTLTLLVLRELPPPKHDWRKAGDVLESWLLDLSNWTPKLVNFYTRPRNPGYQVYDRGAPVTTGYRTNEKSHCSHQSHLWRLWQFGSYYPILVYSWIVSPKLPKKPQTKYLLPPRWSASLLSLFTPLTVWIGLAHSLMWVAHGLFSGLTGLSSKKPVNLLL